MNDTEELRAQVRDIWSKLNTALDSNTELRHRLQTAETEIAKLTRDVEKHRSLAETSNKEVLGQLATILHSLMGDITRPEVPGLVQKVADLQTKHQVQLTVGATLRTDLEALIKALSAYQASMPKSAELESLKQVVQDHKSKLGYFMGWIGGVGAAIMVVKWILGIILEMTKKP